MKKMIAILAITCMGQLVFAQESTATDPAKVKTERKGFHKGKHKKGEMMKQLNLTEEQKTKMQQMKTANKEKRDAIKNNSSLSEDQKKEQLKALKGDQKKGMQSVLTDEQKQKVKEMKEKRKEEKRNHKKMKEGTVTSKDATKEATQN